MKTAFLAGVLMVLSASAFARETVRCSSGRLGESDDYFAVEIRDYVMFELHETSILLTSDKVRVAGENVYLIENQTAEVTSEGSEYNTQITATVVRNGRSTMTVTLIQDGQVIRNAETLACE